MFNYTLNLKKKENPLKGFQELMVYKHDNYLRNLLNILTYKEIFKYENKTFNFKVAI